MGRATTLWNVLSDNSQPSTQTQKNKKKRFKKLCLRLIFFSSIPGGDYWAVERERERERERL